jgi:hypothetical protein
LVAAKGRARVLFGLAAYLLEQVLVARDDRYFKQRKLIPALKKAVEHNVEILDRIAQQFPERISTCDLNLTLFAATAAWKYDILDVDLCTKIDELHCELAHLDRNLDCLLQQRTGEPVLELKGTIQAGVPKTRERCTAVIQLLDQALPR